MDTVLSEALDLKNAVNEHLREIEKMDNDSASLIELTHALEKYHQVEHLRLKENLSKDQIEILEKELKLLRKKMVALAKAGILNISIGDMEFFSTFFKSLKITNTEAERAKEILLKLVIAELYFPSILSDGVTNEKRKDMVNDWMNSFSLNPEIETSKKLLSKEVAFFKDLYELAHPVLGKGKSFNFEDE